MKIKTSAVLGFLLIFAALIEMDFFYLGFELDNRMLAVVAIIGVVFCVLFCRSSMSEMNADMRFAYVYGIVAVLCIVIELLYTTMSFPNQGFKGTFYHGYYYLSILLIYPLGCYMLKKDSVSSVFKFMNGVALIWYILVLAQKIMYEAAGSVLLPGLLSDGEFNFRNDAIRIDLLVYGNIMIIYNFYKLYIEKNKKKLFYLAMVFLGCYEMIAIEQTRMYTITIFICLFFIVLLDKNTKGRFIKKIVLILLAVVIISQTGIVSNLISSFSETSDYGGSTVARTYAMEYYISYFWDHPLLGMGFVNPEYNWSVLHGSLGIAYMDDVGIIGQLAKWGLLLIPLYIIPVIRWIYIVYKLIKNHADDYMLYLSFLIYILMTSGSLIMLDAQRIILYPLSIILFEFRYYKLKMEIEAETTFLYSNMSDEEGII